MSWKWRAYNGAKHTADGMGGLVIVILCLYMTVGKFTSDQELDHVLEQAKGLDMAFEAVL